VIVDTESDARTCSRKLCLLRIAFLPIALPIANCLLPIEYGWHNFSLYIFSKYHRSGPGTMNQIISLVTRFI
jgi:hypothetical protein